MKFIEDKNDLFVGDYAVELYLPGDYSTSTYQGIPYYSLIGTIVKFLAVGNFRAFETEKQFLDPITTPAHPLAIPMMIQTEPSEIDVREVKFSPISVPRKCIVLTYYKNDRFIVGMNAIKSTELASLVFNRLEGGKFDNIPPEVAVQLIPDTEKMNGVNFRVPPEEVEIFVAQRYQDPDDPSQKSRFNDNPKRKTPVSYNMREDVMQSTTYQGFTNEDVNSAIITGINRYNRGQIDKPTIMEQIVRGIPIDNIVDADIKSEEEKEKEQG